MARGDEERPDRPDYKVYRSGRGGRGRSADRAKDSADKRGKKPRGGSAGADGERPSYNVYRASRNPLAKLRGADPGGLREKLRRPRGEKREPSRPKGPTPKPTWRKVLRYALIGAGLWLLLSVVLFAVSAQIQKAKLNDDAAAKLGGFPLMIASPQTILVMGTDARPAGTKEPGAETKPKCLQGAAEGDPPASDCLPFRADTLMLVRAGGGAFEKLSIPRDTFAAIPGQASQKINAAYAFGGAPLQIETVENFLGIDIDHAVIVDFEGFEDLIDAVGGVRIRLTERFKSKVGGGAGQGGITLTLDRGEHTLNGQEALVYARTRKNQRAEGVENDLVRAGRQQQVLNAVRSRLTSPWRAPINFIRGPLIAWNAPKAMVSDMGGFMLPQLALSSAIGGDSGTKILKPSGPGPGGSLFVPQENCEKAVRKFLGERGPRQPECSPLA